MESSLLSNNIASYPEAGDNIITALVETDRLMKEIDNVIGEV